MQALDIEVVRHLIHFSVLIRQDNPIFVLLVATDWLTERPETVLNVMGDVIGLAIGQKLGLGIDVDPDVNPNIESSENPEKSEKNVKNC